MAIEKEPEFFKVIIIGGGQAGLSAGYYLSRLGLSFVILDASGRVGDSWRNRWDSLHLFTPARYDGLAGMPFPAPPDSFPSREDMARYLEQYAVYFKLPIRNGVRVDCLSREEKLYHVKAGEQQFLTEHVIIAMSNFQCPKLPQCSTELDNNIHQLHSSHYRSPSQFTSGDVLVVGAGNSGAEIAMEAARHGHPVWLSGRDTGHMPLPLDCAVSKLVLNRLLMRFLFHRVLTTRTPIGRMVKKKMHSHGGLLFRIRPKQLKEEGILRVARVAGTNCGFPLLADGQILRDVRNVVWCTGYNPSFSWIKLPIFCNNEPIHNRGIVAKQPGLYFVGLYFLYSLSSAMIHAVNRDAEYIVRDISKNISSNLCAETAMAFAG